MKLHALTALAALQPISAGCAHAAREWNDRIDKDKAECLDGSWHNQMWPKRDTAHVQSICPEYGTVVAKIDRKDTAGCTPSLTNRNRISLSGTAGNIRGIHCCSDLSELYNKADAITFDGSIA